MVFFIKDYLPLQACSNFLCVTYLHVYTRMTLTGKVTHTRARGIIVRIIVYYTETRSLQVRLLKTYVFVNLLYVIYNIPPRYTEVGAGIYLSCVCVSSYQTTNYKTIMIHRDHYMNCTMLHAGLYVTTDTYSTSRVQYHYYTV
jgi:hypothetical protein